MIVPKSLRDELGIKTGTKLVVERLSETSFKVEVRPRHGRRQLVDRGFGMLAHRGKASRKATPPAQLDDQGIMQVVTQDDKATRS